MNCQDLSAAVSTLALSKHSSIGFVHEQMGAATGPVFLRTHVHAKHFQRDSRFTGFIPQFKKNVKVKICLAELTSLLFYKAWS